MKRPDNSLVKFHFTCKTYYRSIQLGAPATHEIKGVKKLKHFESWFRLMKNRNRLLYGFIRFADGETWLWQRDNPFHQWTRVASKPHQISLF